MRKYFSAVNLILLVLGIGFVFFSVSQNRSSLSADNDQITVLGTTGMIGDIVTNVTGESAKAITLLEPGIDPHTYQPTAGDIETMRSADIIFYNGLYLEAQMQEVFEGLSDKSVAISEDIDRAQLLPWDVEGAEVPESEAYDPHIWHDVTLWIQATEKVRDTLVEIDSENASTYQENAAEYIAQLEELDQYIFEQIGAIPEKRRYLISTHDAFNYFAARYGIKTHAILGISTEDEASVKEIQELTAFMIENEVRAIFGENIVSDKFFQSVIDAAASEGFTIENGGELLSDSLGEDNTEQDSYVGMIRTNVDQIVSALKKQ